MKRISDEQFINMDFNMDKIVAIRIRDGEFYFLAWMENAPNYKIQQAMSSDGYMLDRSDLIITGDIFTCIQETKEYNSMFLLYITDENDNLEDEDDEQFDNAYEKFLTLVNCYERNGVVDEDDHDILMLTQEEISSFCDMLRDGDYIFMVEDSEK